MMMDPTNNANAAGRAFVEGAEVFTRMWTDFASKMMAAGTSFSPGVTPPDATRQMRTAIFKAWGESFDEFMRSPLFQQTLRQSLNQSIMFRKQINDFLGQMQHEFQGASRQDVDQLMQVMGHVERRITDSFERMTTRLDQIAQRLDKLEQDQPNGSVKPPPAPRRRPRAKSPKSKRAGGVTP